jgi:hypothetical protein
MTRVMINNAQESIKNELYSVIFKIALDTEFRISQIVSLQKDCVYETAKKGEFIILSRRKDSTSEDEQQPITIETKRQIDRAIAITAAIRVQAPEYLKNTLFIVPQNGMVSVRAITRENFRKYLARCCEQAEIPTYTAANRDDFIHTPPVLTRIGISFANFSHMVSKSVSTENLFWEMNSSILVTSPLSAPIGIASFVTISFNTRKEASIFSWIEFLGRT